MVSIGSGAKRPLESVKLSRYACYLIVQNADPIKEVVANGQTYFAIQTRIAEIKQMDEYNRLSSEEEKRLFLRNELARHNSQLADAARHAGVIESRDYAIFQNHGYKGLYGGLDAKAIHARIGLKKSHTRPHGEYGVGCQSVSRNANRRKTTPRKHKGKNKGKSDTL